MAERPGVDGDPAHISPWPQWASLALTTSPCMSGPRGKEGGWKGWDLGEVAKHALFSCLEENTVISNSKIRRHGFITFKPNGQFNWANTWIRIFRACSSQNGNPLQCSCLENPRDGGAWWAAVCGVAQSQTRLSDLAAAAAAAAGPKMVLKKVIENKFMVPKGEGGEIK